MSTTLTKPRRHRLEKSLRPLVVQEFEQACPALSVDELLLSPSRAIAFCEELRRQHPELGPPDSLILRELLRWRKRPRI